MISARRALMATARTSQRARRLQFDSESKIALREPIVPTHKNFDVSPDHPLWAFFYNGNKTTELPRNPSKLLSDSRPWTMAELRLKSFDDLHTLWYLNLRERNVLATERIVANEIYNDNTSGYVDFDDKHALVQKRIKQVLLERQVAYERAQLYPKDDYLKEFEEKYVNADESEFTDFNEKLVRLQYAIFGIEPQLRDYDLAEDINIKFVEGLKFVANLKLGRYLKSHPDVLDLPLNGPMEELPFLVRDPEVAVDEVQQLRASGQSRTLDKIEVFAFLRNAIDAVRSEEVDRPVEEN